MTFLAKGKKADLVKLAIELGEDCSSEFTIIELKSIIVKSENYEESFVKELLSTIIETRLENTEAEKRKEEAEARMRKEEKEAEREAQLRREEAEAQLRREEAEAQLRREEAEREAQLRREEAEREAQLRREEAEREAQFRREEAEAKMRLEEAERRFELEKIQAQIRREEAEAERQFELEKIRIETQEKNKLDGISGNLKSRPKIEIQNLMHKFNPKEGDIGLYLVLFERQARRLQIPESDWVSNLLVLLPYDISTLVAKESDDTAEDYSRIKNLLLKKYKLTPEKFRQMFLGHKKKTDLTWCDFTYELTNYFNEWITGLKINTLEKLCDLMVTDQLKRNVSPEIRDHFIDQWPYLTSSSELAEKLDEYESVRQHYHYHIGSTSGDWEAKSAQIGETAEINPYVRREPQIWQKNIKNKSNEISFYRRRRLRCYECSSLNHLRPQCPNLRKNPDPNPKYLNHLKKINDDDLFSPYTSMGSVNGYEIQILRDSGATIDIVSEKYVPPERFTGEYVMVQQPLDLTPKCLPLAEIELSAKFGKVITNAAIISNSLEQERYILGNSTAKLISNVQKVELLKNNLNVVSPKVGRKGTFNTSKAMEGINLDYSREFNCNADFDVAKEPSLENTPIPSQELKYYNEKPFLSPNLPTKLTMRKGLRKLSTTDIETSYPDFNSEYSVNASRRRKSTRPSTSTSSLPAFCLDTA